MDLNLTGSTRSYGYSSADDAAFIPVGLIMLTASLLVLIACPTIVSLAAEKMESTKKHPKPKLYY